MKDEEWEELLKDLATGLVRNVPMFFGVFVPIPVGLLIVLAKRYHEHFSTNFFKASVDRVRAQIVHYTKLCNDVRDELKYDRDLLERVKRGEVSGSTELLEVKVKQLEEELELLEDKNIILNLALMIREKSEFYKREFGKGIWKKISDYPSDVWRNISQKTLDKYDEKKLNMRAFRDVFIKNVERARG